MMIEQATVIGYRNGVATVQCFAKQGCGGCSAQSACGTKALSALAGEKQAPQFSLPVSEPLAIGDRIEIGLEERSLLRSVFWLYVIPLMVLIGSALLFSTWIENELVVAMGMFIVTFLAFFIIKKRMLTWAESQFSPSFVRKI